MRIIAAKILPLIIANVILFGWTYITYAADVTLPDKSNNIHVVKKGDSLYKLAKQYNTDVTTVKQMNGLSDNLLVIGQALAMPTKKYNSIEVNAYIEPTTSSVDSQLLNDVGKYLTYISPFSYQVNPDGSLNPINDSPALATSKQDEVAGLLVITNFRNGNFDSELAHKILTNNSVQESLINNVLNILKTKGYHGLNIDFERIPPEDRKLYNSFLKKVVQKLHSQNYLVSTALAPKTYDIRVGDWHGAHDYKTHGQLVDFVILMTYEWGWSGGNPMAVAPIDQVNKVIDYAVSVFPPQKIILGMPLYGYDWTLPYVPGGKWARRVSPQDALELAARYGVNIEYDQQSQSPYFHYTDDKGTQHVVWFEDARSVQAKFDLVNKYKLRGVSYWVLGVPFPQNWSVLDNLFHIKKAGATLNR
ncbi:glycosyl hydrolase family 18 protein [Desulfolucanica intricata]|uniref:glycosyl hydrolase family 18 protein n=1 Tax=Desulfolucanica intricata TaxID=1285191 RepID=UPI0008308CD4|nr:glycosyl hydrolase family 18 protein [Desulfolucanica intricata]